MKNKVAIRKFTDELIKSYIAWSARVEKIKIILYKLQ